MRAHFLQHVPFEGLGSIEPWLQNSGFEISSTRFFDSCTLPDLAGIDLLIVMGGPMSVNDEDAYPWLSAEKRFLRLAVESGKRVLGICLGAQLIAAALGARVFQNPEKEIGWFPVRGILQSGSLPYQLPTETTVFHWHGDTFDLPDDAILLASSTGCRNQAFQIGRSVIGLQFHLETTAESARLLVNNCRNELIPSTLVQSEPVILSADPARYRSINALMDDVLSYLIEH